MGIMEALLSFIRRQVGLRTDAANASGSLHAKVTKLQDSVASMFPTVQKPRTSIIGRAMVPGSSGAALLNVSGKGCLRTLALGLLDGSTAGFTCTLRVVVDGISYSAMRINHSSGSSSNYYFCIGTVGPYSPHSYLTAYNDQIGELNLSFKTSLKVEVAADATGNSPYLTWMYEIE